MNRKLRRLFHLVLILAFLGACPGISDGIQLWAQSSQNESAQGNSVPQQSVSAANDDPFAVNTSTSQEQAFVQVASTTELPEVEAAKKKEMGRVEKLAWTIGKALLPTLAVMAFGAAVVCPLAWIIVGSVIIGAATAGITTFAYENRMNQFREEGKKKSKDKILRDVSIAAAVEGAMAPFSMLSAGLVKAIGPATFKTICTAAAKAGAVQFVGGTISNVARGTVTNLWYDHYYNYDEEEKQLKTELEKLHKNTSPSDEEKIRAVEIMQRLDALEKERYTMTNFINAEKKTAVTAAISGIIGGGVTQIAGNQNWAKIASDKLFKSPKNAGLIAKAVVSNPFAFVSGSANAVLQKREMDTEIARCRRMQEGYAPGSPGHTYYEDKIKGLEDAKAKIDLMKSGTDAMVNNLAVQSAALTVAVARARLWDLPRARSTEIEKKMKENSPEWQKAQDIKACADALRSEAPKRWQFNTRAEYNKALASHKQMVTKLDTEYKAAKVLAVESEKSLSGKALREQVVEEVDNGIILKRRIDLAKSLGDEEYLKFKMEEIKKKAAEQEIELDEAEIRRQAVEEFKEEYTAAAKASADKLAGMEGKLTLRKIGKDLKGKIVTDEEGKKFVVLEDADGVEQYRRAVTEPKETWLNKFFQKDPAERDLKEIENAYRIANSAGAMVKPTDYRASYVEMKVNELKAKGYTNEQVNVEMTGILKEANGAMLNTFGGSWKAAAQAEMLGAGLTRAKYNNGEPPDLHAIYNAFQTTAQAKIIAEFQKELSNQAKEYTLAPIRNQLTKSKDDAAAGN